MTRPCLILAAGFGTRMGGLTADRPKPLIEVCGRPLIEHALAAAAGAGPIVVNGHYRAGQLRTHLAASHPEVTFMEETPDILDSGGALKNALPILGEGVVATLNADNVWTGPCPIMSLEDGWNEDLMDVLMLLVPRSRATGRLGGGDFTMDGQGRLDWDRGADTFVHTGAQLIRTKLAERPERNFSLRDLWEVARRAGRLYGVIHSGGWADIGHPGGIAAAEAMEAQADAV